MECGEQCVITLIMAGIVMMLEWCADNWGTMSTQMTVSSQFVHYGKDWGCNYESDARVWQRVTCYLVM